MSRTPVVEKIRVSAREFALRETFQTALGRKDFSRNLIVQAECSGGIHRLQPMIVKTGLARLPSVVLLSPARQCDHQTVPAAGLMANPANKPLNRPIAEKSDGTYIW